MNAKNKNILKIIGILILGFLLGWLVFGGNNNNGSDDRHVHAEMVKDQIWTCSMHPQIRQNEPGDCPLCGMELIPAASDEGQSDNPATFVMSENAMKLANVMTMEVGKTEAARTLRLNGKVELNETNTVTQASHIPGRIESLEVNFTGEQVRRGQTLATVYSPELATAQTELLQAARIAETQPELFEAAKERLRNWRIGEAQIDQIINSGKPLERFSITADVSGIVTEKLVSLGDYVQRGMPIYQISDLSKVWVLFDLYEGQVGWVSQGSKVEFTVRAFPGETFEGEVVFIDPLLSSQSRVAKARVEVDNREGKLKPQMFVSGTVQTALGEAESDELIVPKSAVLWTGTRSVVYVKEALDDKLGFTLREIVLGPALAEAYIVTEGLEPGEEIVVNGTFTVDAAAQLAGKPSMMSPDGSPSGTGHDHGTAATSSEPITQLAISDEAKNAIQPLVRGYLELKDALVNDDFAEAKKSAETFRNELSTVNMSLFTGESHDVWMEYENRLKQSINRLTEDGNIETARSTFIALSEAMIGLVETFHPMEESLYIQHCPMANNDHGADWLSLSQEIRNPYFGASMLRCGEVTGEVE